MVGAEITSMFFNTRDIKSSASAPSSIVVFLVGILDHVTLSLSRETSMVNHRDRVCLSRHHLYPLIITIQTKRSALLICTIALSAPCLMVRSKQSNHTNNSVHARPGQARRQAE